VSPHEGANLSSIAVNLRLSPAPSGAVPRVYEPRETAAVRTAKARDSPHAGTVLFLLMSILKLSVIRAIPSISAEEVPPRHEVLE